MRTSALFGVKNFGCFKSYDASARTREVELMRTRKGRRGQFFVILYESVRFRR